MFYILWRNNNTVEMIQNKSKNRVKAAQAILPRWVNTFAAYIVPEHSKADIVDYENVTTAIANHSFANTKAQEAVFVSPPATSPDTSEAQVLPLSSRPVGGVSSRRRSHHTKQGVTRHMGHKKGLFRPR